MVPSSNPGERRKYFYSRVGDGGLSVTRIDGYFICRGWCLGVFSSYPEEAKKTLEWLLTYPTF